MTPPPAATSGRIVESSFVAHPLMRGAHLQTILPALLRPTPALELSVECLELPDGDFVELGWAGPDIDDATPLAILIHGLGGSFESKYLRGLARQLIAAGWRICALQQRGAGTRPNRLPRAYNHGDSAPLQHLWSQLRGRYPHRFLAAVGWSLGGNVLLKALGESGPRAAIDQAYAVCVPFALRECADHLRRGFARVYQLRLLDACKDMVRRKQAAQPLPPEVDLQRALRARDFFEFDDAYTAPTSGYRDAGDYYARAACGGFLAGIRRPVTILHALDDPFMTPDIVPPARALSPWVELELSTHGGHVGFIAATSAGRPYCWLETQLAERLSRHYRRWAGAGNPALSATPVP